MRFSIMIMYCLQAILHLRSVKHKWLQVSLQLCKRDAVISIWTANGVDDQLNIDSLSLSTNEKESSL